MFTLGGGGEWMCRVPEEEWPGAGDQEVTDAIKLDFMGEWGDRESSSTSHIGLSWSWDTQLTIRSTGAYVLPRCLEVKAGMGLTHSRIHRAGPRY